MTMLRRHGASAQIHIQNNSLGTVQSPPIYTYNIHINVNSVHQNRIEYAKHCKSETLPRGAADTRANKPATKKWIIIIKGEKVSHLNNFHHAHTRTD